MDRRPSHHEWTNLLQAEMAEAAEVRVVYARRRSAHEARARTIALSRVVQAEIIPRLMLRHRTDGQARPDALPKPDTELVAEFTEVVLKQDVAALVDAFTALTGKGYSADELFLDLLAPSAVLLGRLWDDDLCDFVEVTAGLAQLQFLLAMFRTDGGVAPLNDKRRILLMGAPDERHTFGVAIIEQFMRKAGWYVVSGLGSSPQEIAALVSSQWFAVVGLTLSREAHVDHLAAAICAVRRASCNRSIGVMVGGPVFLEHPELVERVGADASAVDAPTAVLLAQRLLFNGPGRPSCGQRAK
ncbi:cobalamin B12-binding domain-containing protein [Methylobacterium sp. WSM2598]|uniref:cobalamin B12-binding domain-containing protein n=1 Tax=Methylobacterium sp. WSM2598 TaxID=398261 RepID=UPI00036D1F3B|nr:cobalamin B12-binding domain-containing protein [Methylobacterium sp. WSM2598]